MQDQAYTGEDGAYQSRERPCLLAGESCSYEVPCASFCVIEGKFGELLAFRGDSRNAD